MSSRSVWPRAGTRSATRSLPDRNRKSDLVETPSPNACAQRGYRQSAAHQPVVALFHSQGQKSEAEAQENDDCAKKCGRIVLPTRTSRTHDGAAHCTDEAGLA